MTARLHYRTYYANNRCRAGRRLGTCPGSNCTKAFRAAITRARPEPPQRAVAGDVEGDEDTTKLPPTRLLSMVRIPSSPGFVQPLRRHQQPAASKRWWKRNWPWRGRDSRHRGLLYSISPPFAGRTLAEVERAPTPNGSRGKRAGERGQVSKAIKQAKAMFALQRPKA